MIQSVFRSVMITEIAGQLYLTLPRCYIRERNTVFICISIKKINAVLSLSTSRLVVMAHKRINNNNACGYKQDISPMKHNK